MFHFIFFIWDLSKDSAIEDKKNDKCNSHESHQGHEGEQDCLQVLFTVSCGGVVLVVIWLIDLKRFLQVVKLKVLSSKNVKIWEWHHIIKVWWFVLKQWHLITCIALSKWSNKNSSVLIHCNSVLINQLSQILVHCKVSSKVVNLAVVVVRFVLNLRVSFAFFSIKLFLIIWTFSCVKVCKISWVVVHMVIRVWAVLHSIWNSTKELVFMKFTIISDCWWSNLTISCVFSNSVFNCYVLVQIISIVQEPDFGDIVKVIASWINSLDFFLSICWILIKYLVDVWIKNDFFTFSNIFFIKQMLNSSIVVSKNEFIQCDVIRLKIISISKTSVRTSKNVFLYHISANREEGVKVLCLINTIQFFFGCSRFLIVENIVCKNCCYVIICQRNPKSIIEKLVHVHLKIRFKIMNRVIDELRALINFAIWSPVTPIFCQTCCWSLWWVRTHEWTVVESVSIKSNCSICPLHFCQFISCAKILISTSICGWNVFIWLLNSLAQRISCLSVVKCQILKGCKVTISWVILQFGLKGRI